MDTEGTVSDYLSDSINYCTKPEWNFTIDSEGVSQILKMLDEEESSSSNHNQQTKSKQTIIEEQSKKFKAYHISQGHPYKIFMETCQSVKIPTKKHVHAYRLNPTFIIQLEKLSMNGETY